MLFARTGIPRPGPSIRPLLPLAIVVSVLLPAGVDSRAQQVGARSEQGEVITIRSGMGSDRVQGSGPSVGIFTTNTGARGLSLRRVVIPPGGRAKAHRHVGHESAVYLIQGTVETRYGPRLEKRVVSRAGDFVYIPADVVHQPTNLSTTEPAIAIEARTDPAERGQVEEVEPRP